MQLFICLLAWSQTKRPLSLKPQKICVSCSWKLYLCPFHLCASLDTSQFLQCLRHGEKKPLAQWRVRSWSWRRSLDRCSGCIFIDFKRICASTVFSCCLWGSVQKVFCLPFARMGLFCAWTPPGGSSKDQSPPKCPQTSATAISHNSICFPALGQHSQRCWWKAWKCPVSSGTIWLISLTSHVRQTTTA